MLMACEIVWEFVREERNRAKPTRLARNSRFLALLGMTRPVWNDKANRVTLNRKAL